MSSRPINQKLINSWIFNKKEGLNALLFIEKNKRFKPYPSGIGVTDFNRSLSWVAKL